LATSYVVTPRYSPKRKLRNNVDVTDYFAGDNEIFVYTKRQQRISISISTVPIFRVRNIDIVSISAKVISTPCTSNWCRARLLPVLINVKVLEISLKLRRFRKEQLSS